jgi:uncharacterized protein (DUF2236 family)
VTTPIVLPWPLRSGLEAATRALFGLGDQSSADFLRPSGEAALVSPDSVSWRVFKNPLSLFIGGVAAVIMELAEPRVRTGVWDTLPSASIRFDDCGGQDLPPWLPSTALAARPRL